MKSLAKIILAAFALAGVSLPCYAKTVTNTSTTVITIRENAPIYMGPVQEVELLELTLADFEYLAGGNAATALTQYNYYQNELRQPRPNPNMVPYKMKITDRDLTLGDFQGVNVSPELAQARYQAYLQVTPIPTDGRNVRYVYTYHTPITRGA